MNMYSQMAIQRLMLARLRMESDLSGSSPAGMGLSSNRKYVVPVPKTSHDSLDLDIDKMHVSSSRHDSL